MVNQTHNSLCEWVCFHIWVWCSINSWHSLHETVVNLKTYLHFLQGGRSILYFLTNAMAEAWVSLLFPNRRYYTPLVNSIMVVVKLQVHGSWRPLVEWEVLQQHGCNKVTDLIRTFTIPARSPSSMMWTALRSPRANASMAPMWAMNRSSGSVDSLRTLASKFRPPGCTPPCSTMVCEDSLRKFSRGGKNTHSLNSSKSIV